MALWVLLLGSPARNPIGAKTHPILLGRNSRSLLKNETQENDYQIWEQGRKILATFERNFARKLEFIRQITVGKVPGSLGNPWENWDPWGINGETWKIHIMSPYTAYAAGILSGDLIFGIYCLNLFQPSDIID